MMTCDVKKGRSRETKGSSGPRRGSKRPQLGSFAVTAVTRCSLAFSDSEASFLPFRLPLRAAAPPLPGAFDETAAVKAAVISLMYCV